MYLPITIGYLADIIEQIRFVSSLLVTGCVCINADGTGELVIFNDGG